MKPFFLLFIFGTIFFSKLYAQYQGVVYVPDTGAKIIVNNQEQTLGFAGGFNNPQFALADLNHDGRNDLVVFERGCEWVRTFINYGTTGNPDYRYRPHYAANFPSVNDYLKLEDVMGCDNIPDLIHRGNNGFSIYKGFYNANNELSFTYYKDLFYSPLTLFQEGFESATFPSSSGWQVFGGGWSRETTGTNPSCNPYGQTAMLCFNSASLASGSTATIVSTRLRISPELGNHAKVGFLIYRNNASTLGDSVSVYINDTTIIDGNETYLGRVARCRTIAQPDVKNADGWCQYSFDIPSQITGDTLFLIFKGISKGGNNIFIDNVEWIASNIYGDVNAYVEPSDMPAIADVDNDGDMDFFSYYIAGAYIQFYKNYRVEDHLSCDEIRVNLKDACWGKVYQGFERTQTLGASCSQPTYDPGKPSKVTHTGNTLCLADVDGDGDYDYFNGNFSFSDVQFLQNGKMEAGAAIDSMIAQDTTWQSNGTIYKTDMWPVVFWQDMDDDGDKDLLLAPHAIGSSENKYCIHWYKNIGTVSSPNYIAQNDSLLTGSTLDLGATSLPMLYDYNKDGKLDLFVGSAGLYSGGTNLRSRIEYYENTSTASHISFQLVDDDFLSLYAQNIQGAFPAVGDIDNDGKDDLLIGHTDGTISFYSNVAANNTSQPVWQFSQAILSDENGVSIDSNKSAAVFVYDMDKDGNKDLVIGGHSGTLFYYRNIGNANQLKLQYQTRKLGNVKVDGTNILSSYSVPFIGKIDNVNKDYLVVGSNSGRLYKYTGFENGNTSTTFQCLDSVYSLINSGLANYSGYRSAPAFGDLDGDGWYEMILGNNVGGVTILKQAKNVDENVGVKSVAKEAHCNIYPNPASDKLYINWDEIFAQAGAVQIALYTVTGQQLFNKEYKANEQKAEIKLEQILSGVYYLEVFSGKQNRHQKLLIIR